MGQEQSKQPKKGKRSKNLKTHKINLDKISIDKDIPFNYLELGDIKINPENQKPTIKILSWNILAECYKFGMTTNYSDIKFSYPLPRGKLIAKIIADYNADIVGLQEVDEAIAETFLTPLTEFGYENIFRKRPGGKSDGCVIAWKKEKFNLCSMPKVIDFNQEAMNFEPKLYLPEKEYKKWNICVYCELQNKETGDIFDVFNTHLYWNPKSENVKYFQISRILGLAVEISTDDRKLLIMGDFNSQPTSITGTLLNLEFPIPEKIENSKYRNLILKESIKIFNSLDYEKIHNLELLNVYSKYRVYNGEITEGEILDYKDGFPEFSNYTENFKGFLDHIIFKEKDFEIVSMKKLPKLEDLNFIKGFPFDGFPSDHLPLGVEISLK